VGYTEHDLVLIADYVMPDVPAHSADIGFLFGTRHGVDEFCSTARTLWERNMFRKLVISGGCTRGGAESEAKVIADELVRMGVPGEALILEAAATNTGENVIFGRKKVAENMGLDSIGSMLVIGKVCSMRRYLMTLERHWPGLRMSACPVNYFGVEKERWHDQEEFRARVLAEFEKIPEYLKRGFVRELADFAPYPALSSQAANISG
jgi:uncharacterized SAM-binding protein YcdF (DUF218 family)